MVMMFRVLIAGLLLLAGCSAVDDVPPEMAEPVQLPCEDSCDCNTYHLQGPLQPDLAPSDPSNSDNPVTRADIDQTRLVIVVVDAVPATTTVRSLLENPTNWLSTELMSHDDNCATMIESISDLGLLDGMVVAHDLRPGLILDARQFRDPEANE